MEADFTRRTVMEVLGIEVAEMNADRVVMTMPITDAARQPYGLLHGGVSVVLAESCASLATWLNIDQTSQMGVGIEVNANHVRAKRDGTVTAVATPIHRGRTMMVWDVRIADEEQRLVCVARCTVAVVARDPRSAEVR